MKKVSFLFLLIMLLASLVSCKKDTTLDSKDSETITSSSPISTKENQFFTGVRLADESAILGKTFHLQLIEKEEGHLNEILNPYKPEEIAIDSIFTSPSGITYKKSGYYQIDYDLSLLSGTGQSDDNLSYDDEITGLDYAKKTGKEGFLVGLRPKEEGTYSYLITVSLEGVVDQTFNGTVDVVKDQDSANYKGKILVDVSNNRYFCFENGGTYFPIGENLAWYTSPYRGSYDYDEWFKRMKEVGMNYARIWMKDCSFALHMGLSASVDDFDKRENQMARLDRVLSLAEANGIYVCLTLLNHGQFSKVTDAEWQNNPYNALITYPFQFFTNATCKSLYKDELRYIIARFGDYDSIFTYELFNEVDWTDSYDYLNVKKWHKEMSEYIKSIDCYSRLITTSYKDATASSNTFALASIDHVSIHTYAYSSVSGIINKAKSDLQSVYDLYQKPTMFEEWGVNASTGKATYEKDPNGIMLYQALMGSSFGGGAGGAMCWWWDTYIHRYHLYSLYQGLGTLTKKINLNGVITYLSQENVTLSDDDLGFIGMKSDEHYYGYLYDSSYNASNTALKNFTDVSFKADLTGSYRYLVMNALTGETLQEGNATSNGESLNLVLSFTNDCIIILDKQ